MTKAVTPLEAAQDLNNRLILDKFDKTQPSVADKREAKSVGLALAAAIGGEGVPRGRAALRAFAELSQAIHIRVADQLNLTDAILRRDKKATNTYATRSNKLTLLFAAIDPAKAWTAIDTMSFQDARALVNTLRRQVGKGTFFTRFEGIESVKRSFIAIVVELKAMLADKLEDRAYVRKTCRDILRDRPKLQQVMGNLMETRYGLAAQGQHGGGFFKRLAHQIVGIVTLLYLLVAVPLAPVVLAPLVACLLLAKRVDGVSNEERVKSNNFACLPRMFTWPMFAIAAGFVELAFLIPKADMFSPRVGAQEQEDRYQSMLLIRYMILFHFYNFGRSFPNRDAYEIALRNFMNDGIYRANPEMHRSEPVSPKLPDSGSRTPEAELRQLGLERDKSITDASLAKAYRREALKLHPDRVLKPGMSEEQRAHHISRFVDMKAAVDKVGRWLRRRRTTTPQ